MIVFSSVDTLQNAKKIAEILVKEGFARCVSFGENFRSFYEFEGKFCDEKEILLIIKTSPKNYKFLENKIKQIHPYKTPEILAFKANKIEKNFKIWLRKGEKMFISTRDENCKSREFSEVLLNPSAQNGGLFVLKNLPKLKKSFFEKNLNCSYEKLALKVIKKFGFDLNKKIFKKALKRYQNFDISNNPAPINKISDQIYINELYHGPTRAFKDMALQPFGKILSSLAKQKEQKFLVMCATSGDTGPATLKTFDNDKFIKVVCLFPQNGTSAFQKLQMINANPKNELTIEIKGDFDAAQKALKDLLQDDEFKAKLKEKNLNLSAANSVNFGRILFQIIYHINAYLYLLKMQKISLKDKFDIIVPSGNFGNALGAYYAKKMGVKIGKIRIASNSNKILTELFNDGIYDLRDKTLIKTISPAMDILLSSNVERLLFDKFGSKRTNELMQNLKNNGFYKLTKSELKALQKDFVADFCTDEECKKFINLAAKNKKLIDPHTATCFKMINKNRICIITSTADWIKFVPSMTQAIKNQDCNDEKTAMIELAKEFDEKISPEILTLFDKTPTQNLSCEISQIKSKILEWIEK